MLNRKAYYLPSAAILYACNDTYIDAGKYSRYNIYIYIMQSKPAERIHAMILLQVHFEFLLNMYYYIMVYLLNHYSINVLEIIILSIKRTRKCVSKVITDGFLSTHNLDSLNLN